MKRGEKAGVEYPLPGRYPGVMWRQGSGCGRSEMATLTTTGMGTGTGVVHVARYLALGAFGSTGSTRYRISATRVGAASIQPHLTSLGLYTPRPLQLV